jgi:transposase
MSERYVNVDRDTAMLMPPDMRDWVGGDDLVHFVIEAVEGTSMGSAESGRVHGGGSLQYPPRMMMALLIYSYANGMFSSRQIERASHYHVSVRSLCGDQHPDHDTICKFRRENRALLKAVFGEVLKLAGVLGLISVGTVCVDGTKVLANAAKKRTLDLKQLEAAQKRVEQQIEKLLLEAEKTDGGEEGEDTGGQLPEQLAGRKQLQAKLKEAREQLAEAARERAEEREQQREQWKENPIGDPPRALEPEVGPKGRINLTDGQCGLMPLARGGYAPGYNAQLAPTGQSHGLIVATSVGVATNDRREVLAMAEAVKEAVPQVQTLIMDSGYDNPAQIEQAQRTLSISICSRPQNSGPGKSNIPDNSSSADPQPRENKSPARQSQQRKAARERSQQVREQMRTKADSPQGKEWLKLRRTTVEPAIGIIKSVLGFDRFSLRGLHKVSLEWELVAVAFNCRRIARQIPPK